MKKEISREAFLWKGLFYLTANLFCRLMEKCSLMVYDDRWDDRFSDLSNEMDEAAFERGRITFFAVGRDTPTEDIDFEIKSGDLRDWKHWCPYKDDDLRRDAFKEGYETAMSIYFRELKNIEEEG